MFWDNFVTQCNKAGKSPNGVCADLGLSTAIATKWKNGSAPRDTTLKKIADYFGVSPDSLVSAPIGPVDLQLFGNSGQLPEKEKKLLALYNKIEDKEGLLRFIERLAALSEEQQKFVFDNLLQGQ